jgi:hypothetical protein
MPSAKRVTISDYKESRENDVQVETLDGVEQGQKETIKESPVIDRNEKAATEAQKSNLKKGMSFMELNKVNLFFFVFARKYDCAI